MCKKTVEVKWWTLRYVPDQYKTQEICNKAIAEDPWFFLSVPDSFVTQKKVKIWHKDDHYCNDSEMVERYDEYKKRKAQKAQIKEELMPIAWHPTRMQDWCMTEDEKKRNK